MVIFLCVIVVGLTTAAQLLLKIGARSAPSAGPLNRYVIFGYALFGLTIVLSYFLMQQMQMKYFTALMSINYVAVAVASALALKEKMGRRRWAGTLLIATGVALFVLV